MSKTHFKTNKNYKNAFLHLWQKLLKGKSVNRWMINGHGKPTVITNATLKFHVYQQRLIPECGE